MFFLIMSSFVELGFRDICADCESFYLSLYVLHHTPEVFLISKIKDDKPFTYFKRMGFCISLVLAASLLTAYFLQLTGCHCTRLRMLALSKFTQNG